MTTKTNNHETTKTTLTCKLCYCESADLFAVRTPNGTPEGNLRMVCDRCAKFLEHDAATDHDNDAVFHMGH